jgi:hypothetical protein
VFASPPGPLSKRGIESNINSLFGEGEVFIEKSIPQPPSFSKGRGNKRKEGLAPLLNSLLFFVPLVKGGLRRIFALPPIR